ncbi:dihydrofolate reductase family protein [Streptosporangium sp. NPDC050855]|uniref:dihydrofolate reductase family protein n=1 Tax=Streptosporangium sp. NPDC050855 TaxID=3366194 RepID=UPI00378A6F1B
MSIVVTVSNISLDGVIQAPGRADEDPRGGFEHGGWSRPYSDEVAGRVMGEGMSRTRALVLGRRTYEDFFGFWPRQRDNPFTEVLAATPKYVASRTLREPLPWANSVLMAGDAADEVARLRKEPGGDLVVLGSGDLLRSLMRRGLVDRYVLLIHPLVLGAGRRLFAEDGAFDALRLADSVTTTTGVVIATYEPAGSAPGASGPV